MIACAWAAGAAAALVATLPGIQPDRDFDGLTNLLQIPFALPWFLLPVGTSSHVLGAWIAAGMGLLNAALLYFWLARRPAA